MIDYGLQFLENIGVYLVGLGAVGILLSIPAVLTPRWMMTDRRAKRRLILIWALLSGMVFIGVGNWFSSMADNLFQQVSYNVTYSNLPSPPYAQAPEGVAAERWLRYSLPPIQPNPCYTENQAACQWLNDSFWPGAAYPHTWPTFGAALAQAMYVGLISGNVAWRLTSNRRLA